MHGRFRSRLLTTALLFGALLFGALPIGLPVSAARADDAKPSWACLPEDTLALVRIPAGNKAAEALRTKTKIGAMLFDPGRIAKIREAVAKEGSDEFEEASKTLEKYGLKLDDCYKLLEGEAGLGVVLQPGDPRLVAILGWLEPDADLATRLMTALDKLLDDIKDEDLVKRKDIELAGQKVIHLTIEPATLEEDDIQVKPGEEKIDIRFSRIPMIEVLLARKEGRLLSAVGVAIPKGDGDGEKAATEEAARDRLKEVFARFLVAHDEKDSGPKLRYLEAPGVASALPGGLPLLEAMVDFRPVLKMLDVPEAKQAKSVLKAVGFDQLGVIAYRATFDKSLMRSGMFVSAPSPRGGLLGLLDQQTLSGEPPAWVPAELIDVAQFSLDFGKAYSRIKQLVINELGDVARNNFDTVESQVNQLLQTDVATLLSALGTQHTILDLPPRKTDAAGNEGQIPAMGSNVFVLRLTDEALWKRVMQTAAVFAQTEMTEEQGFQGIRIEKGAVRIGAFIGRGFLVVSSGGTDTIETILSNLRNPPAGSAALAGSKLLQRASELLAPRACLVYSVVDMNRYAKILRGTLLAFTELAAGDDDSDRAVIELIRSLMPSEDELNGALGVSTGQMWVDDHGVTARSVGELPAP